MAQGLQYRQTGGYCECFTGVTRLSLAEQIDLPNGLEDWEALYQQVKSNK